MSKFAAQSVTITEALDAVNNLLVAASGYPARHIMEWHFDKRPNVDTGGSLIWFRFVENDMAADQGGAGRHGAPGNMTIEINFTSRGFMDGAQRDKNLMRKHIVVHEKVKNAFYDRQLFESYNEAVGSEPPKPIRTAPLTLSEIEARANGSEGVGPWIITSHGVMTAAKLPAPDKPRPEHGYMETRIGVNIPIILRLTLFDVPQPGEEE